MLGLYVRNFIDIYLWRVVIKRLFFSLPSERVYDLQSLKGDFDLTLCCVGSFTRCHGLLDRFLAPRSLRTYLFSLCVFLLRIHVQARICEASQHYRRQSDTLSREANLTQNEQISYWGSFFALHTHVGDKLLFNTTFSIKII